MRILSRAFAPLALLLIVTGFFWKLLTKQYTWIDQPDMVYQVLPWYQFQSASWHRGLFPLWDPHVWAGQPLIGQLQPGAAYPLNWPIFLLPLKDGHINPLSLHFYFIATHFLAALFCYWLCRELKRSQAASIVAGAAFSLSGVTGALGWPQMLNGAIWIPLVLLFFVRWLRVQRIREAAWSGTFLGMAFLSGHHQIPIFTALMMGCLWLVQLWRRRAMTAAGAFLLFTVLVSAFQVLPAYEYGKLAVRFVGLPNAVSWIQYVPYSVHEQNSLRPLEVAGLILPGMGEHDTFIGIVVFTLGLVGFAARVRNPLVRMLGAIAVGALVMALGASSIFHGVAYLVVPEVEKARSPAMAMVLVQFAIATLAAYGLDALRVEKWKRRPIRALTIAGILPWPVLMVLASVRSETGREYQRFAVFGLVALGLALVLRGWRWPRFPNALALSLILGLALLELGTVIGSNFTLRDAPHFLGQLESNADVVQFLRSQPDFIRLEVDLNTVPYNIGDWDGIDQFQGYLGGLTSNVLPLAGENPVRAKIFSLTHYVGREHVRPELQEIFRGKSGVNVYRDPVAYPRAWTVHEVEPAAAADILAHLEQIDLRRKALLIGQPAPALESCGPSDDVRVTERSDNRVQLDTRMACRGMVVLSETFFPGWRATVDGRTVQIYEADGALRGVIVEAGEHHIDIRYRPMSVYAGAVMTGVGLLGAVVFVVLPARRKRLRQAGKLPHDLHHGAVE